MFSYLLFAFSINAYKPYNQGDLIIYNNNSYYVLYDSESSSNVLTLLKAEPLTIAEVEKYGIGHINNYSMYSGNQVYDYNNSGYGRIVYYSSLQCGLVNGDIITNDCKYDYDSSDVKCVVDAWAKDQLHEKDLWKDNLGYSYRLITKNEILEYMNYSLYYEFNFSYAPTAGKTPSWLYNEKYFYFTMSDINKTNKYGEKYIGVYNVFDDGLISPSLSVPYITPAAIRPVILLMKKALESNNSSNTEVKVDNKNSSEFYSSKNNGTNESGAGKKSIVVDIPDTFTKISVISIMIGICLIGVSTIMYLYNIKKRGKNEKDT